MKSFPLFHVLLLLGVLHLSSAFVPLSTRSRARRTPHTNGAPSFSSGPSPASVMGTISIAHADSKLNSNVVLKAKKGAKKSEEKETSEKGGMETKYKIGWGIVAFGLLYDFFVTHAGVFPWQEGGVW
jgi:hypothetical protein